MKVFSDYFFTKSQIFLCGERRSAARGEIGRRAGVTDNRRRRRYELRRTAT